MREVAGGYALGKDYTPSDIKNVVSPVVSKLTERQQDIFSKIVGDPLTTIEKMAKALDVSTRTVDRDIEKLKNLGYIRKSGKDNKSPWEILK